jgi:hypothetical protein
MAHGKAPEGRLSPYPTTLPLEVNWYLAMSVAFVAGPCFLTSLAYVFFFLWGLCCESLEACRGLPHKASRRP